VQGLLIFSDFPFQIPNMSREEKRADERKSERPEAYPHPTETDQQLKNQPEYIDQQPNEFHDKSISDIPGSPAEKHSDDPEQQRREG
jgi:hypothetical protein